MSYRLQPPEGAKNGLLTAFILVLLLKGLLFMPLFTIRKRMRLVVVPV